MTRNHMNNANFLNYASPFSWRYGTKEMREVWSEINKRKIWRKIWVVLAEIQSEFGLVTREQVDDLKIHASEIDISRSLEIESIIRHDVMAEVKTYAEQCQIGGGIIHLGMTSMDVVDNTDALRVRQSLDIIIAKLNKLLLTFVGQMEKWNDTPVIGFTHLQPAEPTTIGYRLSQYAQDFMIDSENIVHVRNRIKGKGIRGAVGTSASYSDLFEENFLPTFEKKLSETLNLDFFSVTTQVYPRKQDYDVLSALAGLGASVNKFSFDLRILQSPAIGEISEPFSKDQVGSSAMPFKRNPIRAESANSLARILPQLARVSWDNAALSLLERTLDDSANRRSTLPEAFLIADELLSIANSICRGLRVNQLAITKNLETYGPFAATERILTALSKVGANRQDMHERIRKLTMDAWEAIEKGQPNPLSSLIANDAEITEYIPTDSLMSLMNINGYVGDSRSRTLELAKNIKETINQNQTFVR